MIYTPIIEYVPLCPLPSSGSQLRTLSTHYKGPKSSIGLGMEHKTFFFSNIGKTRKKNYSADQKKCGLKMAAT